MIAVSDAVLIVVSTVVLGSGFYRWQNNVEQAMQANAPRPVAGEQQNLANNAQNTPVPNQVAARQISAANGTLVAEGTLSATPQSGDTVNAATSVVQGDISRNTDAIAPVVVQQTQTSAIDVADDVATTASNESILDVPPYGTYRVQSGDSLSKIAVQYGTTVAVLQDINDIEGTLITIDQEIRYPLPVN